VRAATTTCLASRTDTKRGFNRLPLYLYTTLLASLTLLLHLIDARPAHAEFEFTPTGATAAVAPGQSAVVSGTDGRGLRVRSGPGMSHKIVTTLNEGTTVQIAAGPVSDGEDDWFQVSVGTGTTGWAIGKYLVSPTAMRAMSTVEGQRVFLAKVTAYADGTGGVPHGAKTYSGTKTRWGVVAVDPKVIPIGSTLQIEGYEGVTFMAEDVGGGIKGESLDIWLPDSKDARSYGTQYRKVTIIREGPAR
jgi:3D (Asp-Asp-Asp) domain-containing protein